MEKNGKVEADLLGKSMSIKVVAGRGDKLRRVTPDWDAVMRIAR